jgi:FtsP/CotA-like multicopper oxidase with cupredoxin domain
MMDVKCDRRQFIQGSLVAATAIGTTGLLGCGSNDDIAPAVFDQPPVLRSANGVLSTVFNVGYAEISVQTPKGNRNTKLRTWNGFLGGTTLRVKPGDRLIIVLNNKLPPNTDPLPPDHNTPHHFNSINLHTHGLHVSPNQDNVLLSLMPGDSYTYTYDIPANHPAGTFWYHAHKHGATAMHLFSGMAGLLIVEGEVDKDPAVAAATDLDFVIEEINLKGLALEPPAAPPAPYQVPEYTTPQPFQNKDSFFLVNGKYQPRLQVAPGRTVRLRVLNASARNAMPISVDGAMLTVISLDGITLPMAKTLSSLTLAPGNRADIILRFDAEGSFQLKKGAFTNGAGNPNPQATLAWIDVSGPNQHMSLPTRLTTPAQLPTILPSEVTEKRSLVYEMPDTGGPVIGGQVAPNFTINGVRFDPAVINQTIPLNAVVEWTLQNNGAAFHSHHIHINPFQVIATSTGQLNGFPLTEPVWLDTVGIPALGSVTVRQRFVDFKGSFVLHCHVLVHEDIGMMALVKVV